MIESRGLRSLVELHLDHQSTPQRLCGLQVSDTHAQWRLIRKLVLHQKALAKAGLKSVAREQRATRQQFVRITASLSTIPRSGGG